jgi:glycosyltransferase involved in cell wall biosynthesis
MAQVPTVAIDFRWLDHLSVGNGQYRYAVDLINGLAELDCGMRFVVLGSRAEPVAEIAGVFERDEWRYVGKARRLGRFEVFRELWRYFWMLRRLTPPPSASSGQAQGRLLRRKTGLEGGAPDHPSEISALPWRIDLFHGLHSFVPVWPPVPMVETVYDMMLELFPEYAAAVRSREYRLHKWAFGKFVTRAIAISRTTAADLERLWKFPAEKIDVVYLAAKLPEIEFELTKGVPTILAPYNLEPRKNLSCLLEAAARLKASGVSFRLVLFGRAAVDDERERRFRHEVARLGLESLVELTGRVSDEELTRLYASCAVFVYPSLYEGFGLPVLEAMSCGARVVAHGASAMAEVVGDAGYLVDMNDVGAIAERIRAAMVSDIGERARERARTFSRERMARQTVEVYRRALGKRVAG